jgi:hypothetical protein
MITEPRTIVTDMRRLKPEFKTSQFWSFPANWGQYLTE